MQPNMIGAYGPWAASLVGEGPAALSFRNGKFNDIEAWRKVARQRLLDLLAQPGAGGVPKPTIHRQYAYDGLHVEELAYQLPYGPPTEAIFLKPEGAVGRLPGILALHDHGGNKFFGRQKITQTARDRHPVMVAHQERCYGGLGWANEIARRGYAVLVHDTFPFASRRVRLSDVPERIREGLADEDSDREETVAAYNRWAGAHESLMAKSLFCAGTTWPGVYLTEDQRALDLLCARDDVDPQRVGCGGLSGGGMRTVFLGGADPRIKCAVCVGMMTTWRDYLLNKCHTHTWMVYLPLLPRDLDYPEILGLRVPLPTLVQNDLEDPLFTVSEMERADRILREVYEKAGRVVERDLMGALGDVGDRYRCTFYPGPHKFDLPMQAEAFAWFDQWLKD